MRWLGGRRRRSSVTSLPEPFEAAAASVQAAKDALLAAVPRGRTAGAPLAEALAGFEDHLRAALGEVAVSGEPEIEEDWRRCREALSESLRAAERLRLEESPEGYEELYAVLGEILDPLEIFADVERRLQRRSH